MLGQGQGHPSEHPQVDDEPLEPVEESVEGGRDPVEMSAPVLVFQDLLRLVVRDRQVEVIPDVSFSVCRTLSHPSPRPRRGAS